MLLGASALCCARDLAVIVNKSSPVKALTSAELGKLAHFSPQAEQAHTLYLAVDVDRGPVGFNFGIGRGLNSATDKWTVKAIFEIPFGDR